MRTHITLLLLATLILTSCTSKHRAEETAKDYIIAVIDNNPTKETSLLYQDSLLYNHPNESYQFKNIKRICVFDRKDIEKLRFTCTYVGDDLYGVMVKNGVHTAYIYVVKNDKREFKILSSKGLFYYDFSKAYGKIKCNLAYEDDQEMARTVHIMERDLTNFKSFSDAVASTDSVKLLSLFPALKSHKYIFKNIPTPISYTQIKNDEGIVTSIVTCSDSTSYKLGSNGIIIDCRNIIPTSAVVDSITALGKAPIRRNSMYDIEYITKLNNQYNTIIKERQRREQELEEEKARKARELAEENERKARVAKIKSQGVALISSQISSNGNGAKGIKYTVLNTSNKTAKYVSIDVVGYNAVDDPVLGSNGYVNRCNGIGPVRPGDIYSWDFDDIWHRGDLIESYQIKTLIIQFSDGTSKRINLPKNLPSDWRTWLY